MLNRQKTKRARGKSTLPTHAKRHAGRLFVMNGSKGCNHSLARHEEIQDPSNGRKLTISYALPCVWPGNEKHTHFDVYGREW